MQTPHLPQSVFGQDFQRVYEPAEDTFLLLDALESELDSLRKDVNICLECGSGSGTIITALTIALKQHDDGRQSDGCPLMLATDINPDACRTSSKCANYHNQGHNIQVIQTDLAESIADRLEESVDLLVFNPPYVPTDINESVGDCGQLPHSWAGGDRGRLLIDKFLHSYVPRLLSKPNGVAFMVAVDENNISELCDVLVDSHGIAGKVVTQRRAGSEMLHVIKYHRVL